MVENNFSQSPFSEEEWEVLERAVLETAKEVLTFRKFLKLVGPVGPSHQVASYDILEGFTEGVCAFKPGEEVKECEALKVGRRVHVPIPVLYKDFIISWRDIEYWRGLKLAVDTTYVKGATLLLARAEDRLILYGNEDLGIEGLLTVKGSKRIPMKDWGDEGNAFYDIHTATTQLIESGHYGPFVVVMNPKRYAQVCRVLGREGTLEIDLIKKIVKEVYTTPLIGEDVVLVLSTGEQNMDLFLALDFTLVYVESTNLNHKLRVMEMLVPRIKRPDSFVILKKK